MKRDGVVLKVSVSTAVEGITEATEYQHCIYGDEAEVRRVIAGRTMITIRRGGVVAGHVVLWGNPLAGIKTFAELVDQTGVTALFTNQGLVRDLGPLPTGALASGEPYDEDGS